MKRLAGVLTVLGLIGLATAFVLWLIPADEFIFAPDPAEPLADRVTVEGARPAGAGDVYFVDVLVRRTTLLEQWLPFTRPDGSTVVPEHVLLPSGTSEEERARRTVAEMARSEEIASAVALTVLGHDVEARPRGALVIGVAVDVPAATKIDVDDVIVAVDGTPVRTAAELRQQVGKRRPGADVRLTIRRDERSLDLTVRTVADPNDPSRPLVGIQVDQAADITLPFRVDIDLGSVGGPSAGLAFALEIARKLGRDVTHGCRVAATGELALDGSVLSVGGLEQKTIGARRADVDLFLVPAGDNAHEAEQHAEGLRILPVESFQQALHTLATSAVKC